MNLTDKKIQKLLDCVIKEEELTTKLLSQYGLTSTEIKRLKDAGHIESIARGKYKFINMDLLYEYGCMLEGKGNFEGSEKCFTKCGKTKEDLYTSILKLIYNENYDEALQKLDKKYNYSQSDERNNLNFLLLLISLIYPLSNEEKKILDKLKKEDICLNSKKYFTNKIRESLYKKDIKNAMDLYKSSLSSVSREEYTSLNLEFAIVKKADAKYNKARGSAVNHIAERNYEEALQLLKDNKEKLRLSIYDDYLLKTVEIFLDIEESHEIPSVSKTYDKSNVFKCIDANDFKQALNLSKENTALYNVLSDIVDLIDKIKEEDKQILKKTIPALTEEKTLTPSDTLIEVAISCLGLYLANENREAYNKIVQDFVALTIKKKDKSLEILKSALVKIREGRFEFTLQEYIQDFYQALSKGEFDIARIYIDLIENGNKIGHNFILTGGLKQILEITEKQFAFINLENQSISKDENEEETEIFNLDEDDITEEDCTFLVMDIHDRLITSKGYILLESSSVQDYATLERLLKKYDNIIYTKIFDGMSSKLVFRYYENNPSVNTSDLCRIAKENYNINHEECIKYYEEAIRYMKYVNPMILGKVGISYGKLEYFEKAIEYLSMANGFAKITGSKCDFTDLLKSYEAKLDKKKQLNN